MIEITSTSNPRIKEIRKLNNRKERAETGLAYIEGLRIVIEAFEQNVEIDTLITCPSLLISEAGNKMVTDFASSAGDRIIEVNEPVFRHLSGKDGPQGLAAVIRQKWSNLTALDLKTIRTIVALDQVADPGNLGTILRTADASGVSAIILLDNTTDPYDPASIRASIGALFDLPLIKCSLDEFITWKTENKLYVTGAAGLSKTSYHFAHYPRPMVLLMGSERHGLTQSHLDVCDQVVSIPMQGRSDSLNLAMATGIILYEILNHQRDTTYEKGKPG
jgi:TrmH family RNA methyltransferase